MKLSVSIVTFQERDYVRQALESVLAQRTDFAFEIVVGDDASSDGTGEVLREIAAREPGRVRLILHERNLGDFGLSNFMSTVDACRGEYVAFLDGDDYWTDPDKLQRQVDFLDAHPGCALCAHRVVHVGDDGTRELSVMPRGGAGVHGVDRLLLENFAPKVSTVARRSAIAGVPEWFRTTNVASADWLFNVLLGRSGEIGYLQEAMAVHRDRVGNLTSFYGTRRRLTDKLGALDTLKPYFPRHRRAFADAARKLRWQLRVARLGPRTYALARRWNKLEKVRH